MSAVTIACILGVGICIGFVAGAVWASPPHDDDDDGWGTAA